MSLAWEPPLETGGCPVFGYYLMRDDGVSGTPSIEVNTDNDPTVRNLPTLRYVDAQLLESNLGLSYTFQLYVTNREGTIQSPLITYLFATEPEMPSSGPEILSYTSELCEVRYLFTDSIQGSDIISFNLVYREQTNNVWTELAGGEDAYNLAT